MGTGRERALARELQAQAAAAPLALAPTGAHDSSFFRQVDRQTMWGLTLNK